MNNSDEVSFSKVVSIPESSPNQELNKPGVKRKRSKSQNSQQHSKKQKIDIQETCKMKDVEYQKATQGRRGPITILNMLSSYLKDNSQFNTNLHDSLVNKDAFV